MTFQITPSQTDASGSDAARPKGCGATNQNPDNLSLLALLREDKANHYNSIWEQGFWALAVHRFGNWRMGIKPKAVRLPFSVAYKFLNKWVEWTCGISLPYTMPVGRRVRLWHHGGMILHAARIGNDVQIRQNTTIGVARTDHNFELPVIEDHVDIGAGAVIIGSITVGRGAVIGANAVVNKDVPAYSVAVGVPARVIKQLTPPSEAATTGARGSAS